MMDTNTAGVLIMAMLLLFYYGVYRLATKDDGAPARDHVDSGEVDFVEWWYKRDEADDEAAEDGREFAGKPIDGGKP